MCGHALIWWAVIVILGSFGLFVIFGLGYMIGTDRPCRLRPHSVHRQDGDPEAQW